MKARFTVLLTASLMSLMLSGQAAAGPRQADSNIQRFAEPQERRARDYDRRHERARHENGRSDRKDGRRGDEGERGYGYGYERRNPHPGHDERGRR